MTLPVKRNIDDVLNAIAAAHADTRGRILGQIDQAADAEAAVARRLVSITLEDYSTDDAEEHAKAEWRYRKELERALGGSHTVCEALRAFTAACESDPEDLTPTERALAERWVAALPRARSEGMAGLSEVHAAWFDVRMLKPTPAPAPVAPVTAAQGSLF
jgi:hypothetical protein